jgi:anti-anti-sigma factor
MKSNLDPNTGTLAVFIEGDLVSTSAEPLRGEISRLIAKPTDSRIRWQVLRLDLSKAKVVDSVGLNFIVTILKAIQKEGAKMQIVYANQNVHRTFLFTRLDRHLELIYGAAA